MYACLEYVLCLLWSCVRVIPGQKEVKLLVSPRENVREASLDVKVGIHID